MTLYQPSRDQARQFLFDAWAKFKQQSPLTDLEKIAVEVIQMHPEYHATLTSPQRSLHQHYFPEMGETNPFLHLNLHLSIIEQVRINQPVNIASMYQQLCQHHLDAHLAQHEVMDCLAESIWHAQRHDQPLDASYYLNLLNEKLKS